MASVAELTDEMFGPGTAERMWSGEELEIARREATYSPPGFCKHVKIKVTGSGQGSLAHPMAQLGTQDGVRTLVITEVPLKVSPAEVVRRYNLSIDSGADYAYLYRSLGTGRILR